MHPSEIDFSLAGENVEAGRGRAASVLSIFALSLNVSPLLRRIPFI